MALEERIRNIGRREGKITENRHRRGGIRHGVRLNVILETYRRIFSGVSLSSATPCPILIDCFAGVTDLVVLISQPVRLHDLEVVNIVEEPCSRRRRGSGPRTF
jgi:hypothetical protein